MLAPAAANAAPSKKATTASSKAKYPVVTSISPRKVTIGEKLTIRGKYFKPGKGKSSVAFYATGKAVVFVRADSATSTSLVVTISDKVGNLLKKKGDTPVRTLLRLRVVGAKMGREWTQNSRSPLVSPLPPVPAAPNTDPNSPAAVQQAAAIAYQNCQQQAAANPGGDQDADGLSNITESGYKLDPCTADTDADGVSDGYEFFSAIDLNGSAVPYPGTRPWPNALDPSDVNSDFDGDGLFEWQEYKLWKAAGAHFPLTQYSDGTQNSGGTQPVAVGNPLDIDGDGNLTDDERDFDGDGLSNITEFNFRGTQHWWATVDWKYKPHVPGNSYVEPPYTRRQFSDLDPVLNDSDGDSIPDGLDDQDNDGWNNTIEMQYSRWDIGLRVHPFNPCLPDPNAATCSRYVPLEGSPWPPFDKVGDGIYSGMPGDAQPFGWPEVDYSAWVTAGHPLTFGLWAPDMFGPWNGSPFFFAKAWDGSSGPQGA